MNDKIKVPESSYTISIPQLNENIKNQISNLVKYHDINISIDNETEVKSDLNMAKSLIDDCYTLKEFKINRNGNFNRLAYEYQLLSAQLQNYRNEKLLEGVSFRLDEVSNQQDEIVHQTGNLVYNILGFIASFSVVAASVGAVDKLKNLSDVMLFMAFTAFILITTLIALNNFYKKPFVLRSNLRNRPDLQLRQILNSKSVLQNNYFLWKMLIFVIIMVFLYKFTIYVKENRSIILEDIGKGIEKYRTEQIEK